MPNIIAFANHKGGVGKTTSVANIGAALASRGRRVLLVDLDAQANLTYSLVQDKEIEVSVYHALTGKASLPVINVGRPLLDLAPSSLEISFAEIELSSRMAREKLLAKALAPVAGKYDYILMDCPPSLGLITTNALVAAQEVYIPLTAEALPLKGMTMLDQVISEVRDTINPTLKLGGVFITRYNNRNLNNVILESIKAKYGPIAFNTRIRENIALAESPLTGKDIFTYSPGSNGAKDYEDLTNEILERWER